MVALVIDTNVFVSAMRSQGGASRSVLRGALEGRYVAVFGNALWLEYEDVLGRDLWTDSTTTRAERKLVMAALASVGRWVHVSFDWRPNLPDEGDNHLIELAVAAGAEAIVTHNVRHVARGELLWENLRVLTPAQCLETWP
jgi:putative PIN family toxin of toxin-antitoxin system